MGLLTKFLHRRSRIQSNAAILYGAGTGNVLPPKARHAPKYELSYWIVQKHANTARIHLHGFRSLRGKEEKHNEYVTVGFLPGETDAELIRCAAWLSPNHWHVPFRMNMEQFSGGFNAPLDARLLSTLPQQSAISSSGNVPR